MRVVPREVAGKIAFCHAHAELWLEHAEAIGITPEMASDLQAKTEAARVAWQSQYDAMRQARAATAALKSAVAEMTEATSLIISHIRAKANTGGHVYALAAIPAPKKRSPIAAPGTPFGFTVALDVNGRVTLKWKCKNPRGTSGTMYHVWRRIGRAKFEYLGLSGGKQFVDNTIPAGSAEVRYQVQAARSTTVGEVAEFNVSLGVSGALPAEMIVKRRAIQIAA
jgi:hypothetical protein